VKLCIVTHKVKKGDGQGRVNYEVALEAIRRGHHLTLLASDIAPELAQNTAVNWIPLPVTGYPTEFLRDVIFAQKSAAWLRQHGRNMDLIKVNGAITSSASDVNAVHFVHSSWLRSPVHISRLRRDLYGFYQWLYTRVNAHWEKQAFHRAKTIVAVSQKVADELVEIGVPPAKIRVIVNGVDLQEFAPGTATRQKMGLLEHVTLALFAGDLRTTRKNLDTVLQALVQVPDLHLVVVGKTAGSPFPQLAADLGISQRVHFLGYRQDIAEIMRSVDFFVFPSRYEACSLVLLEALSSGLPVITAQATGGAELVAQGAGSILPDTDDRTALAEALFMLAHNPSLRQQMGKTARSIAEQHSWKIMAQNYLDLFEELIQHEEHGTYSHLSPSTGPIPLPFGAPSTNLTSRSGGRCS
jgi:glycosyltransferase involved in cell wall biosynthesis